MLKRIKSQGGDAFFTRERCFITEILNHGDSPELSVARCRVEPGVTTELHRLRGTREVYVIEAGAGVMDDGTCEPIPLNIGDALLIPAGHQQRLCNTGPVDLSFQVVCTPRFMPNCYEPL